MNTFFSIVRVFQKHLFLYLFILISATITVSSVLILRFESAYPSSDIKTVGDAVWWSAVGISTIGIGNIIPVSEAGRYLTLFLMVVGVIIFSVITAKIASIFTEEEVKEDIDRDMKILEGDLNKVEHDIEGEVATDDRKVEDEIKKMEQRLSNIEKSNKSK